jgi:malate dehydrogenase (oxaloacetate-decarboxylating)(NADP+)
MSSDLEALRYHKEPRPGKIEVVPSKPCLSQSDLSLAYTPGVAAPCLRIQQDPDTSFDYTTRGNLVAVITNGTAVLGLGNIGPLAGKPVMEGKGVLFKRFADLDVFDIEVDTRDPNEFIQTVKLLEPTFGGINLEDIRAPDCFYIEERLTELLSIPVFHDDQHGTAIISGAALLNACDIQGHRMEALRIVINGAGAAGIACARMYVRLGARQENLLLIDSQGVIYKGRERGMNRYKEGFAVETPLRTLEEAAKGAHLLVGLSVKGAFTRELLSEMGQRPIVFALANPEPEIAYDEAKAARPDAIVATGHRGDPEAVEKPVRLRRDDGVGRPCGRAGTRHHPVLPRRDPPRAAGDSKEGRGPEGFGHVSHDPQGSDAAPGRYDRELPPLVGGSGGNCRPHGRERGLL